LPLANRSEAKNDGAVRVLLGGLVLALALSPGVAGAARRGVALAPSTSSLTQAQAEQIGKSALLTLADFVQPQVPSKVTRFAEPADTPANQTRSDCAGAIGGTLPKTMFSAYANFAINTDAAYVTEHVLVFATRADASRTYRAVTSKANTACYEAQIDQGLAVTLAAVNRPSATFNDRGIAAPRLGRSQSAGLIKMTASSGTWFWDYCDVLQGDTVESFAFYPAAPRCGSFRTTRRH
jgi:hypothetical protein